MISIIIPVYNTAPYLNTCIESVVKQSFTDWECILIDDGSTDESGAICEAWSKKDARIRTFHQANAGVSTARNQGLKLAKGDIIAFVDSDDWVEKNYLCALFNAISKEDADLAVCGMILDYTNDTHEIYSPSTNECFELSPKSTNKFVKLNEKNLLYGPVVKLYKKQIICENNVVFDSRFSYGEDLLFNYQYLNHVRKISTISNSYYHYRIFSNNTLSKKVREDQFDINYKQWRVLKSFYVAKGMWNDSSKALLYKRLWGILYDAIFQYSNVNNKSISYLHRILCIPEINDLKDHQDLFSCSTWIKYAILHRCVYTFWCYFNLKK